MTEKWIPGLGDLVVRGDGSWYVIEEDYPGLHGDDLEPPIPDGGFKLVMRACKGLDEALAELNRLTGQQHLTGGGIELEEAYISWNMLLEKEYEEKATSIYIGKGTIYPDKYEVIKRDMQKFGEFLKWREAMKSNEQTSI